MVVPFTDNFSVFNRDSNLAANENTVNVQTLERCLNERIDTMTEWIVKDFFREKVLSLGIRV